MEKKGYHAIRDGFGTTHNQSWVRVGGRKAHVPAAETPRAPEWPCPGRAPGGAPSGPKLAQNPPKRALLPLWGAQESSVVQVDGQNQLGYCLSCLLAVFGPMC